MYTSKALLCASEAIELRAGIAEFVHSPLAMAVTVCRVATKCVVVHSFGEGAVFRDNRFCKIESINRNRKVSAIDNRFTTRRSN